MAGILFMLPILCRATVMHFDMNALLLIIQKATVHNAHATVASDVPS